MRVYLDANILFSAAKTSGAIRALLRNLRSAGHDLVSGPIAIAEAKRNLENKAPGHEKDWALTLKGIHALPAVATHSLPKKAQVLLPEKDQRILAEAISASCQILCTGDQRHFGALMGKDFNGVVPLTPLETARQLLTPPS